MWRERERERERRGGEGRREGEREGVYDYVLTCCSLRRQVQAINVLADAGMFFWDYGNAFLLEASRAGSQPTS